MKKNIFLFILLALISTLISIIYSNQLNLNLLLQNALSVQLTKEQIENYFKLQEKWQWLSYFISILFLLLKTSLVASVIFMGTFFYSKTKVTFKDLWHIVVKAEFLFVLVTVVKIIWFNFFQTSYTLEDLQYFYPLCALNIIGYHGLDAWLIYPLQVVNLFELAYIIYLSYQVGQLTQTNADNGLKIVGYSYVPALLLWVAVVMFFTLNYT